MESQETGSGRNLENEIGENESGENERGENENENVLEWPIQMMQERMSDVVYHGLTGEILQCILF